MSDKKVIIKAITKEVMKVDWISEQFEVAGKAAKEECKQDIKKAVKTGYKKAAKTKVVFAKADEKADKTESKVTAQALAEYNSKDPIYQDLVLISKDQLRSFIADSKKLDALEAGGVDNWSYYSEALHEGIPDKYEDMDDYYNDEALKAIEGLATPAIENFMVDDHEEVTDQDEDIER